MGFGTVMELKEECKRKVAPFCALKAWGGGGG